MCYWITIPVFSLDRYVIDDKNKKKIDVWRNLLIRRPITKNPWPPEASLLVEISTGSTASRMK